MNAWVRTIMVCLLAFGLTGCVRYVADSPLADGAPQAPDFDASLIEPVLPRPEPLSAYGNHSPYEVFGEQYQVLPTAQGYQERGIASWYGTAFHGRKTSSGEPYDIYQLTAAHKTLPLPTYVEVTHLDTGRSIVVRVNDRGPFKPGRIIDLSWAAAVKLGIEAQGTAPVEVRALTFEGPPPGIARPARVPVWVQAGAFSDPENAQRLKAQLESAGLSPVAFEGSDDPQRPIWRVKVGPLMEAAAAIDVIARILDLGLEEAQYVYP